MIRTRLGVAALTAALLGALIPVAALGQDGAETPEGVEWSLSRSASDGVLVDVPADVAATLLLEDGAASGSAGCNSFNGSYTIDGSTITFDAAIATTLMACEGDAHVVEDAYLQALPTVSSWSIADGGLQLADADASPVLVFDGPVDKMAASDIDRILAALAALQARVGVLEDRVTEIEAADGSDDGVSGDGGQQARSPRAPSARGSVETAFPEYLRDPFTPPDQVEDPNQEVVRWRDRSNNEDGFRVYARRGYCTLREGVNPDQSLDDDDYRLARTRAVRIDSLPANQQRYRPAHLEIADRMPAKPRQPSSNDEFYELLVAAYNEAGESQRRVVASFFLTPEFRCP
jgi:heat shock protein HslJ